MVAASKAGFRSVSGLCGAWRITTFMALALASGSCQGQDRGDAGNSSSGGKIATLSRNTTDSATSFQHGRELLDKGNYSQAVAAFSAAIQNTPRDPSLFYERARAYIAAKKLELAVADLDQAIVLEPAGHSEYYVTRAEILRVLGRYKDAKRDYLALAKCGLKPEAFKARLQLASMDEEAGNWESAVTHYSVAIDLEPGDLDARLNRALACESAGQYGLAILDYTFLIKVRESVAGLYVNRGCLYRLLNSIPKAMEDFDKALALEPGCLEARIGRSDVFLCQGDLTRALAECEDAVHVAPKRPEGYAARAKALIAHGERDRGFADFEKAIRLAPNVSKTYWKRATAYVSIGAYKEALLDYDRAIQLDPRNADLFRCRATTHRALGDSSKYEADMATYKQFGGRPGGTDARPGHRD